jgi:hypothetical protein
MNKYKPRVGIGQSALQDYPPMPVFLPQSSVIERCSASSVCRLLFFLADSMAVSQGNLGEQHSSVFIFQVVDALYGIRLELINLTMFTPAGREQDPQIF